MSYELIQKHKQRDGENTRITSLQSILDQCSLCKLYLSLPQGIIPKRKSKVTRHFVYGYVMVCYDYCRLSQFWR